MGIVDDLLSALDRIPIWKRLHQVPEEVDDLKARISALEAKLGEKWPADVCRFCGARAARLNDLFGPDSKGYTHEYWVCSECNRQDERILKPR